MSEEESKMEEKVEVAPGLALALSPDEGADDGPRRRGPDPLAALRSWQPSTRLGGLVMNGQIVP